MTEMLDESEIITSRSGAGLMKFFDVKVRTDGLVARFRIKNRAVLTDQSLQAYETRFRRALTMYFRWLDNDPDWVGKVRQTRIRE